MVLLLLAFTWLPPGSMAAEAKPDDGFDALRRPVLGLGLEGRRDGGLYRLVDRTASEGKGPEDSPRILAQGSRAACEKKLVEVLEARHGTGKLNLPVATFGGKQVWADEYVYCGWRIQSNEVLGHSRLLDPDDVRRAWGSPEACRVVLEKERLRLGLRPRSSHLVVLVHGLFRSKASFAKLALALAHEGYEVASISYPSTRRSIPQHADQLEAILDAMDGARKVSFVTHSMGGIVVRELLARDSEWKKRIRVHRLVMLGPPNRGSVVAMALKDWLPYQALAGSAGQELTPEYVEKLPAPACPFGIIAGGTGKETGLNPLLSGDNDGTVLVESTRLDSAKDFLLVRCLHSFLMRDDTVIAATLRFLKHGAFRAESDSPRTPDQEAASPSS